MKKHLRLTDWARDVRLQTIAAHGSSSGCAGTVAAHRSSSGCIVRIRHQFGGFNWNFFSMCHRLASIKYFFGRFRQDSKWRKEYFGIFGWQIFRWLIGVHYKALTECCLSWWYWLLVIKEQKKCTGRYIITTSTKTSQLENKWVISASKSSHLPSTVYACVSVDCPMT